MKKPITIEFNPAFKSHGYMVRWVENASTSLRLVGFADEILPRLRHKGWFTDEDFQDETYRGIVYQLPSHKGETRFAYGYADPCNNDCALLCFDLESDKETAARHADRLAELFAREQRDYSQASRAGSDYAQLAEDIKEARKEALAIGAEMRAAKRVAILAPVICATARAKVVSLYRSIQKDRKKRAELLSNFGKCQGFKDA